MQVSLRNSLMLEGARVRLKPLMREVNALRDLLGLGPLDAEGKGGTRKKGGKSNGHDVVATAVKRNRKPMTAKARKLISIAQKKRWAAHKAKAEK